MARFLRTYSGAEPPSGPEQVERDGSPRRIGFPDGRQVTLQPLRIVGRKAGVVAVCAVRIRARVTATLGQVGSSTEVIECHRLAAAGALRPSGRARRIGLIYNAGTPNTDLRAPVVLIERAGGRWAVDESADAAFEELPPRFSLRAMANALAARPKITEAH